MNAILLLPLIAISYGNDPDSDDNIVVSQLKFKAVKEWNSILPHEQWTDIGDFLPIAQNDLPGFTVKNKPNTLSIDTNADGKPDKDIRGIGDFVTLKGKKKDGSRFPYAARVRSMGDGWQFASSCIMTGKVLGQTVTLFDLNNNNIWNEIGTDGITIGKTDCVSRLGSVLNLKGALYDVRISDDGSECTASPYQGDSGILSVAAGYQGRGSLDSAVFRSQSGDVFFDLANTKKGLTVPTGHYVLDSGMVSRKKTSARIRRGEMEPIRVDAQSEQTLTWGGPIYMDFEERAGDKPEEVLVYPPQFFGSSGEEYHSFFPVEPFPVILVEDERGKEIWSGKFCTS